MLMREHSTRERCSYLEESTGCTRNRKVEEMKKSLYIMQVLSALLLAMTLGSGCTIIRYVEGNNDDNSGGDPPPPKIVDLLVLVELDRNTVQLADDYQLIISNLQAGLATSGVSVRKLAVAPMYRRTGSTAPLIYGQGEDSSEFFSPEDAIRFYAMDDGQRYLRDSVDTEGENLATIGMMLDTASIYNPRAASTDSSPYFTNAADGFIVLQLNARARNCGHEDAGCLLEGKTAATFFTAESSGKASWLELPSATGLASSRIFHLNIATPEGVSDEDFVSKCEGRAGFNASNLDHMEPSAFEYYTEFSSAVPKEGGWAKYIDMCEAMSSVGVAKLAAVGKEIGGELR